MLALAVTALLSALLLHVESTTSPTANRCDSSWEERSDLESYKWCYLFEKKPLSWRGAFWACRELDAELFEPVDENEMSWVSGKLNEYTDANTKWHVYGHRDLYGPDAWHSGAPLHRSFGIDLEQRDWAEEPTCFIEGIELDFHFECALLRYNGRKRTPQFELSYSSCLHADSDMGFICKRKLRTASRTSINVPHRIESEWIVPTHNIIISTNEYTISKTASELSWYEAMQMCRKKGGELPTIENVAEVSWIRTQWLLRSNRNNPQNKSVFIFYVNLHKWVYNLDGWGWSSGAPLNISGITLQSGDFCTNYSESSCASLDWTNVSSDPYMLEDLCQVRSTFMTLVCKRPKTSRERSTTSHRPNDKILWCFERKWVLLTVSSVLVFVFVLLTMALVVYCALSRRAHKRYNKQCCP